MPPKEVLAAENGAAPEQQSSARKRNWATVRFELILDHKWFDRLVRILAVVALGLAAYELSEVRKLNRTAETTVSHLDGLVAQTKVIVEDLPTKYLGGFPRDIIELTKFIEGAQVSLEVITDFPGYGSSSEPRDFAKYWPALLGKPFSRFKLKMLVYDKAMASKMLCQQYQIAYAAKPVDCDSWSGKRIQGNGLWKKRPYWGVFHVAPPETFDKLLQDRSERQAEYRSDLYRMGESYPDTVAIKTSGASFGAFVWIRDGAQMIVSFLNGEQDDEFTFRTDNKQIVDFFSKDFDDRFKKGAACTLETNQRGWLLH